MVRQLTEAHQRGDPIAALWASEESIYGRFGYGLASFAQELSVRREDAGFARPFAPCGTFRFASSDEALPACQRIWAQLAAERPGVFGRSEVWWRERVFEDAPGRQEPGGGPRRCVLYELDGEVRGYAIYRHRPHLHEAVMHSDIDVLEAVGADAEATRALWRWLFDLDLAQRITAHKLPLDHPLTLLAAHPRRLQLQLADALWVRLVDVEKALSARTYAEKERLVLEVRDAVCPWNAGRWALEAGRAERTEDELDLAMEVDALGSAYLGGMSFRALAEAFRVEERTRGAVELADALFRVPRLPWCPEIF
jgi:predicted acetyltransferase